jgi:hypothetical protein
MMVSLEYYTITELRAMIQWRKEAMNKIYANWDSYDSEGHATYERYKVEVFDMIQEIDRRKEARKQ